MGILDELTITRLEKENKKLKDIVASLLPEKSGRYFICGASTTKDENGLPDRIHVCPTYGVDWVEIYERKK